MGSNRKNVDSVQQTQRQTAGSLPLHEKGWRRWLVALGVLCLSVGVSPRSSADQLCPDSQPSVSAPFDFHAFTKHKPFELNTCMTTPYGPAWADVLLKPDNFLECKGASIALCYYSGPGPVTPCEFAPGGALASCTCYEVPPGSTYFVDINAILNLDVYLKTIKECGSDGSGCLPRGPRTAPVCDAINKNTLIPGADLISTFSVYLENELPIGQTQCTDPALYAGCMTAPCNRTGDIDPATGLPLAQCACPTFDGPYQIGQTGQQCVLDDNLVWSAAYAPGGTFPPPPPSCVPDAPSPSGCPLLSPKPPNIPSPPSDISCEQVCDEYKKSAQGGVEVGFTCDATLCTATIADPDLVEEACSGLGDSSVSEILKLETEVGFSCAASQICGCQPKKKTNDAIFSLNERQRARGISPQCDLNGTLCGRNPRKRE
jgi:hypothetical protein